MRTKWSKKKYLRIKIPHLLMPILNNKSLVRRQMYLRRTNQHLPHTEWANLVVRHSEYQSSRLTKLRSTYKTAVIRLQTVQKKWWLTHVLLNFSKFPFRVVYQYGQWFMQEDPLLHRLLSYTKSVTTKIENQHNQKLTKMGWPTQQQVKFENDMFEYLLQNFYFLIFNF